MLKTKGKSNRRRRGGAPIAAANEQLNNLLIG
jgi:hypothetical protein